MYSVWRNDTRLGVLTHVQDIAGKSSEAVGFGGVLVLDDPTLTFKTMSQTRLVYLSHAPVFQHVSGMAADNDVCHMTTVDGRKVTGTPLRAVPNDAPGISADAVLEIRRDDTDVVHSNWISLFCSDFDASAEAMHARIAIGLPTHARQIIHVTVISAASWPQPEFLEDVRAFENAT